MTTSRAMEDAREAHGVLVLVRKRQADAFERVGEWKNFAGDQQVLIFGADGVPVHTFGRNRDLRDQVAARQRKPLLREPAQHDLPDDAIGWGNPFAVQKRGEPSGVVVARHGRREADAEAFVARDSDAFDGTRPGSGAPLSIVELRRRAIKTDLQCDASSRHAAKPIEPTALEEHSIRQYGRGRSGCTHHRDLIDVGQQKRFAAGDEELPDRKRGRFSGNASDAPGAKLASRRLR